MARNSTHDCAACCVIQPVHTDASTAYAAGDAIGTNGPFRLTRAAFQTGLPVLLRNLSVGVNGTNKPPMTLILFKSQPTATYTDNSAYAPSKADVEAIVGVVSIVAGDYYTIGTTKTTAALGDLGQWLDGPETGRDLWAALVADGAFTPATTQETIIKVYTENQNL